MKKQKRPNRFGCEDLSSRCIKAAGHVETVSVDGSCRESLGQGCAEHPHQRLHVCGERQTTRNFVFTLLLLKCGLLLFVRTRTVYNRFHVKLVFSVCVWVPQRYLMPRLPRLDGIWEDPEGVEKCCPIWSVHFLWNEPQER